MGITVCVASGDNGSSDGVDDGGNHVDFPASSPHALACGGTSVQASGTTITGESVWNDGAQGGAGGGGVSTRLPAAGLAGGAAGDADIGRQPGADDARRAGRQRRCRPGDRATTCGSTGRTP